MDQKRLIASGDFSGTRIDKFLSEQFPEFSRSYIQKLIKDGQVTAGEKVIKSNYKISGSEEIILTIPDQVMPDILPENIPLDILYEDQDLIVVNKPKGMVVHPAAGHYSGTLVNAIMYHCGDELSGINGVMRPGIVHRIDQNTTGSLLICKNDMAHNAIAEQLKVHSITRKYRAIVHGNLKMAIEPRNGKEAITHYQVLERFGNYTYIECQLETGRTHQIRVHMSSIHHPIVGDDVYGPAKCPFPGLQGQTLHAQVLGFIHPRTGQYIEFSAPLPEYFENLLKKLRNTSTR